MFEEGEIGRVQKSRRGKENESSFMAGKCFYEKKERYNFWKKTGLYIEIYVGGLSSHLGYFYDG